MGCIILWLTVFFALVGMIATDYFFPESKGLVIGVGATIMAIGCAILNGKPRVESKNSWPRYNLPIGKK